MACLWQASHLVDIISFNERRTMGLQGVGGGILPKVWDYTGHSVPHSSPLAQGLPGSSLLGPCLPAERSSRKDDINAPPQEATALQHGGPL